MSGRRNSVLALVTGVCLPWLAGCEGILPEPDWERMIQQERVDPYERVELFEDQRGLRPLPPHTVVYRAPGAEAPLPGGTKPAATERHRKNQHDRQAGQAEQIPSDAGARPPEYLSEIPMALSLPLLRRGQERFSIFCAPCHGDDGYGATPVARAMALRKPPALVEPPVSAYPPGRHFEIITHGYGLMPSYRSRLSPRDRWAVVAYLQALQLSQNVQLESLPAEIRRAAEAHLK